MSILPAEPIPPILAAIPPRPVTRPTPWVDGIPMGAIAPWGELVYSSRVSGRGIGPWEASWSITRPPRQRHPALVRGAKVTIQLGPSVRWTGRLDEPDFNSDRLTASGILRTGENTIAFNGANSTSSVPNTAVDQAIARDAVDWDRATDLGTTPYAGAGTTPPVASVSRLLDAANEEAGNWWHARPDGLIYDSSDPSATLGQVLGTAPASAGPDWLIAPGVDPLGVADDDRIDRVFILFERDTDNAHILVDYDGGNFPFGGIERGFDVTHLGPITTTRANAIAKGIHDGIASSGGWTNGLSLTARQVTTLGGTFANLALVDAGHTFRKQGQPDPRTPGSQFLDFVAGQVTYDTEEDAMQVDPIGMQPRTLDGVLEDVGAEGARVLGGTV